MFLYCRNSPIPVAFVTTSIIIILKIALYHNSDNLLLQFMRHFCTFTGAHPASDLSSMERLFEDNDTRSDLSMQRIIFSRQRLERQRAVDAIAVSYTIYAVVRLISASF